jgi:hypothetical protein
MAYLDKSLIRRTCVAGRRRTLAAAVCASARRLRLVGGFVTIAVVTRVVRRELSVVARVAFFATSAAVTASWDGWRSASRY